MTDFIWNSALDIFITVTTFLTACFFFSLFSAKKTASKILTLVNIISFIVFFFAQFFEIAIIKIPLLIICSFVISLNYNFKLYNKILFTAVFIALNGLVELFTTILISIMFSVSVNTAMDGVLLAFGALISKLLVSVVFLIIATAKKDSLTGKFKTQWLPIYVLPVATFLVTHSLYYSISSNSDTTLKNLSLINLILLILSNMLVFKIINGINEAAVKQNELLTANEIIKNQEKQYNLLIENNDKIIKLRHDRKNFIIGILSMLENNRIEETKSFLGYELNILNDEMNTSLCGNSVIDSLIYYKRAEAHKKDIKIDFEYRNVANISISEIDLALLIGNAIDNAVESLEKSNSVWNKAISVKIFSHHAQTVITVSNPVEENIDVSSLKTQKGDMHGYGIISMSEIAKKYNGDLVLSCEDKIFKAIILLHNSQGDNNA